MAIKTWSASLTKTWTHMLQGYESAAHVVRQLRQADFRGYALIRSAKDEPAIQKEYMAAEASDFLPKGKMNVNALASAVMLAYLQT